MFFFGYLIFAFLWITILLFLFYRNFHEKYFLPPLWISIEHKKKIYSVYCMLLLYRFSLAFFWRLDVQQVVFSPMFREQITVFSMCVFLLIPEKVYSERMCSCMCVCLWVSVSVVVIFVIIDVLLPLESRSFRTFVLPVCTHFRCILSRLHIHTARTHSKLIRSKQWHGSCFSVG